MGKTIVLTYKKKGKICKEYVNVGDDCAEECKDEPCNEFNNCQNSSSEIIKILPGGTGSIIICDVCEHFAIPFNSTQEGTATIINNVLTFYSAPRFSGNAIALLNTCSHGCINEVLVKVLTDTTYKTQSGILVADGTNIVSLYNVNNTTSPISSHSFVLPISEIASNSSDMLIYGTSSTNSKQIIIYDWILGKNIISVIDITNYLPPLSTAIITGLGYDNVRNILYVGLSSGSKILALSFYPYVRYPSPISPYFVPYFITIPNTAVLNGDESVSELAIETNSGNIYFTAKINPLGNYYLYLMTNTGIMLGSTDGTYYTPAEQIEQVGKTNDNKFIVNFGGLVYYIGNPTLLNYPSVGNYAFTPTTIISDFATPLYGM